MSFNQNLNTVSLIEKEKARDFGLTENEIYICTERGEVYGSKNLEGLVSSGVETPHISHSIFLLTGLSSIHVESVSCGLKHVLLGTNSKFLYSFGQGDNGRLGHGDTSQQASPKII